MYSRWEIWLVRAMLYLFQLIFVFTARFYLCDVANQARDKWRYSKSTYQPLDTGKQPKFLVWLLYTDVRSFRSQNAVLRLNMVMWIVATFCFVSEILLGWLPLALGMRVVLAACAVFFGLCSFIGVCMNHKRIYGSSLILYGRERKGSKSESSIFDLILLVLSFLVAGFYFQI